ncbi:N-methyl-L-tryptophan oxidase [Shigella flexneri]
MFVRSGVINLGPADSAFLANVAHSAEQWQLNVEKLDAQGIMARWPEYASRTTTSAYLILIPVFCAANWRLKPHPTGEGAGCAQLFNCPVTAIRHDDDGVTIETVDGEYQAKKAIVCAGTWVKDLLPELPVQPVRKVFAWYQADGRYSVKNKFPAFTGKLPNGDQYYGFPAENDALKIGKHNGGQVIHSADERVPFAEVVSDGSEAFPFLRNVLPGIGCCLYGAACTYDNSPDEDFIIDTLPDTIIHCSLPA